MIRNIIVSLALLGAVGCGSTPKQSNEPTIYVSIAPLKGLVERITGDDFEVKVLVPAGASPETYEPTPKQFIALNESEMIFSTGLIDFETALLSKIKDRERVVDLSRGIELIAGTCSHGHGEHHHHDHGVDPHIWTSARALKQMAKNAFAALEQCYPDSVHYLSAYSNLIVELAALDTEIESQLEAAEVESIFIYHPALTYYARDYGIEQIAIEHEGKEPSAKRIAQIIEQARSEGVDAILYQAQFPASSVEIIAGDIGAKPVQIDPLREDFIENIKEITATIIGEK